MIHIRELDHIVLRVFDLDKMLRFYCGTLACSVERRQEEIGLIQLRAGRHSSISPPSMAISAVPVARPLEPKAEISTTSASA